MQNKSSNSSQTIKFSAVDPTQIWVENISMGKGKESVPLIRYGKEKKTLLVQGPWIKMSQYGIPPGEILKNGQKNEYLINGEVPSRDSIRFPLDERCAVQIDSSDSSKTNVSEMVAFIDKLKAIDKYIRENSEMIKEADIHEDDIARYKSIYRKPGVPKKKTSEPKEKYYYMKAKLDTNYSNKKEIQTDFYNVDRETGETTIVKSESCNYITLEDLENLVDYNCEVQPIFQFVKIWKQSSGDWGVTLKLKKCRVKKSVKAGSSLNAEFVDSDEESEHVVSKAPVQTQSAKKAIVAQVDSDTDSDSDEQTNKADDSDDANDSEDSSSEEPVVVKKVAKTTKPVSKKAPKKLQESDDSGDESAEEIKPVKKGGKTTTKKATA
jgi:hypothetical protein